MAWRLANSIEVLRREVDARFPGRNKASDGTIGDAAHATRSSDHNPFVVVDGIGVVRAIDVTHDPGSGCHAGELAEHFRVLANSGDRRVRYVIWDRQIFNPSVSTVWRPYSGVNPHTKHVHLSVSLLPGEFDRTGTWGIVRQNEEDDMLRLGDSGVHVKELQQTLNSAVNQNVFGRKPNWYPLAEDGAYGSSTKWAVTTAKEAVHYSGNGEDAHPNFVARLEAYSRSGARLETA